MRVALAQINPTVGDISGKVNVLVNNLVASGRIKLGNIRAETGDVTLTLEWESEADIDLRVVEPDGTEISWEATESPSGCALDLDSNAQCAPGPAVEHIVWPEGAAPTGEYTVRVTMASCDTSLCYYSLGVYGNR